MDDADEKPMVSIDPRYLLTGDVVERPPDERPKHDTIEAILDWLAGPAQQIPSLNSAFDEFAWRMLAAGFPLLRATLHTRVYSGNDWLITKIDAPHVAREAWTVKFEPKVVADVGDHLQQVAKIVGVSDDLDRVQRCEADSQAAFGQHATANRSQPYYLDVTNKDANKGAVVEYLSRQVGVPAQEIATIGDQPNDVLMFKRSGFSIAMGNASDEVKAQATAVTDSYNDEGFAKAMEAFILGSTR
jgi:hydroxymethylpyrimidine pyrophosphatase-like HAD family hydrolase